jgi:hypothetical protein
MLSIRWVASFAARRPIPASISDDLDARSLRLTPEASSIWPETGTPPVVRLAREVGLAAQRQQAWLNGTTALRVATAVSYRLGRMMNDARGRW